MQEPNKIHRRVDRKDFAKGWGDGCGGNGKTWPMISIGDALEAAATPALMTL